MSKVEIFGKHPDARIGEHIEFCRPTYIALAACLTSVAPIEASHCSNWLASNIEFDADAARDLGEQLSRCLMAGLVDRFILRRNSYLAENPQIPCAMCLSGISCDNCDTRLLNTTQWYRDLFVDDVEQFSKFAERSGGFSIHSTNGTDFPGASLSELGLIVDSTGTLRG